MYATLLIILGALFMQTASTPALAASSQHVVTLPNGFTILVQEDERFPLASLRLYVHAGSAFESLEHAGISHLLEHMVFKGTEKRKPGQVAQDVEKAGGSLNAATSFDYTVYLTDMPADKWDLGMEVIHDMVFKAAIDPEELEREKLVVLEEIKRSMDNPDSLLFKRLQPLTWGETTYAHPVLGFEDTVKAITRQDILDYIANLYQPQSMLLVVVGNVDADTVIEQATKLFGPLRNDRDIPPVTPFEVQALHQTQGNAPRMAVVPGDWNKVYLSLSFPLPGFRSARAPSLEVLAQLLGGDKTSRLYRKFKYELQLVHDISAYSLVLERSGMFYIRASLDRDKLDAFWEGLLAEFAGLQAASFTDEELERAKLNLEDSLFQAKETLPGLASKLGFFQFFEQGELSEQNYLYALRHVSRNELQEALDEYVLPAAFSAVLLTPDKSPEQSDAGGDLGASLAAKIAEFWPADEREHVADAVTDTAGDREVIELGQGRTLVLLPDATLPYTSISLALRGGDLLLAPQEQGLADLGARTLTKGTQERSANALQDFLSDRASSLSASANRDALLVQAKFPTRFSAEILPLFKEVITRPTFAPQEVERERTNQVAAIKGREDQPLGLAFRHIFPFLFNEHPYGYYHLGQPEEVLAFTPEQVRDFWDRQRGAPWTMAVCGDYDKQAILALAKDLAESLGTSGSEIADVTFTPPQWNDTRDMDLHLPDRNQTHLLQVFEAPALDAEDSAGLKLLQAILAGQSGLLFNRLRDEQGLGYAVTAFLWQSPAAGFMVFYIGTSPDKAEQALQGFKDVVGELRDTPLPDEALERGKNQLQGDYYRGLQSLASRSSEAASLGVQGQPLDRNTEDIRRAGELTADDLRRLARKYLDPEKAYLMRVTPGDN